eukprot:jgi/Phyca11/18264/fgenesh1_pg.PHYCAscaffold_35_\
MVTLVTQLCKVDKTFLNAFLKLVPNPYRATAPYGHHEARGDRTVYKFGYTSNKKKRFGKQDAEFGTSALLDTVVFIPSDKLSGTEKRISDSLSGEDCLKYSPAKELDKEQRKCVRKIMQTIVELYHGSMLVLESEHEKQIAQIIYDFTVKNLNLVRGRDVLQERLNTAVLRLEKDELQLEHEIAKTAASATLQAKEAELNALRIEYTHI